MAVYMVFAINQEYASKIKRLNYLCNTGVISIFVCSNLKIVGAYFVDYSAISTCHRCHEGWKGEHCTECIKLEGCSEHGNCNNEPFTCQCDTGWTGRFCECPICKSGNVIAYH